MSVRVSEPPLAEPSHLLGGLWNRLLGDGTTGRLPTLDLRETEDEYLDEYLMLVDLPGVTREDVEFRRNYWLGRCIGFTVEADGRPCGRVEWVRYGSRIDRPDALVVRRGRLRRRQFIVRADDVREIDPWLERVVVGSAAGDGTWPETRQQRGSPSR
jgi:hypothetical protein